MHMQLDRRPAAAHRAEAMLPVTALTSTTIYLGLDWVASRVVGGYWGGLAAIALATIPVAAVARLARGTRTPRQALWDAVAFGCAVAGIYAWVFTAPFVSLPGW
ncbi:MAG: hypothetical protein U0163_14005 [Gemmatimonadaceae bacterium]